MTTTSFAYNSTCPNDGQCDFRVLGEFSDRSGHGGVVEVWRCGQCGLGVSYPPIPDVSALYTDRTNHFFQPSSSSLTHFIKKIAFRRGARALLSSLPEKPTRIIDFGCGNGLFTRCLSDELQGGEVIALDYHDEGPSYLGDVKYRKFSDSADLLESGDLVLAMHVLEHDDDTKGLVTRFASFLKPGGRLIVEVPHIDCLWNKVFGAKWDAWYLPYHRSHFSRASLRALLTASGLTVEREIDACVPWMGRSFANLLGQDNSQAIFFLLGVVVHPVQWLGERLTGRPSALRFIARKIG